MSRSPCTATACPLAACKASHAWLTVETARPSTELRSSPERKPARSASLWLPTAVMIRPWTFSRAAAREGAMASGSVRADRRAGAADEAEVHVRRLQRPLAARALRGVVHLADLCEVAGRDELHANDDRPPPQRRNAAPPVLTGLAPRQVFMSDHLAPCVGSTSTTKPTDGRSTTSPPRTARVSPSRSPSSSPGCPLDRRGTLSLTASVPSTRPSCEQASTTRPPFDAPCPPRRRSDSRASPTASHLKPAQPAAGPCTSRAQPTR